MPWRDNPAATDCYAFFERGEWYGVVVYPRDGPAPSKELVLREQSFMNASEALRHARKYLSEHPR